MITLTARIEETIKTETCEVIVDGEKYTYIEYINDKEKVIDAELHDSNGEDCTFDAALMERVQYFVDNLPPIK